MSRFAESTVEDAALAWLEELGWAIKYGPDLSPVGDTLTPALSQREREKYSDVVLDGRLRQALARLNPTPTPEALGDAFRRLTRLDAPPACAADRSLLERNRAAHRMLVNGVNVEYRAADDSIRGDQMRVIDFDEPANNDWLASKQLMGAEDRRARRP